MIHIKMTSDGLDEMDAQLGVVFAYRDVRPLRGQAGLLDWRLNGQLSRFILEQRFLGELGDALLMPAGGRVGVKELMILGLGDSTQVSDQKIPQYLSLVLERLLKKQSLSFCLSLSDLVPGMFEWRNSLRLLLSMLSGKTQNYRIVLMEPVNYVEDARRRHMDFSYDVQVQYA